MPLPLVGAGITKDAIQGVFAGTAEALKIIASGRHKSTESRGKAQTEAVTDAEYEEMLKLQKASD